MEKATFAQGCFWSPEVTYRNTEGVTDVRVGYTGGTKVSPTYKEVCSGTTGHAEAVEITFDPSQVSYEELLDVFWDSHDPTQLNRQGPDFGAQYRSAIFYHGPEQQKAAVAAIQRLEREGRFRKPIVTQIVEASEFWPAEDYHQRYLEKRGLATCRI